MWREVKYTWQSTTLCNQRAYALPSYVKFLSNLQELKLFGFPVEMATVSSQPYSRKWLSSVSQDALEDMQYSQSAHKVKKRCSQEPRSMSCSISWCCTLSQGENSCRLPGWQNLGHFAWVYSIIVVIGGKHLHRIKFTKYISISTYYSPSWLFGYCFVRIPRRNNVPRTEWEHKPKTVTYKWL